MIKPSRIYKLNKSRQNWVRERQDELTNPRIGESGQAVVLPELLSASWPPEARQDFIVSVPGRWEGKKQAETETSQSRGMQ